MSDLRRGMLHVAGLARHASLVVTLSEDIFRSFTTLGSLPINILVRHFDVASLAVNTAGMV
jgi:hypothetical protein